MIVIGFYTTDPVYSSAYKLLARSLDRLGHKYDFHSFPPSEWKTMTDLKPRIILESLNKYKEPVLYIDADAFVHENLDEHFSSMACDMAVNFIDKKEGGEELLSGTIYFDYNDKVIEFIELWISLIERNPELIDQQNLQKAVEDYDHGLKIHRMSSAYTYIFDRQYDEVDKPIIEHLQASREIYCRNEMGGFKNKLKKFFGLKVSKEELLKRRHVRLAELEKIIAEQ
ncbi:putative nucleotide-diphospho-sugar transferase [Amphritea sp.]|uniref:putative nucleotide-diphospho-sugar transferase n=1 Tax=Amphritea sp. TaxID=1872502 RepID=UPI003A910DCE